MNTNLAVGVGGGQRTYLGQTVGQWQGANENYDVEFLMQDFLLKTGAMSDADIQALAQ